MKEITITNIQHFSIGDGPGIRTTVFLKGCNLHCPWCHNPETISPDVTEQYGRICTIESIVDEIMEDVEFYQESGGGVTLSGGEPLLQADACAEIAQICGEEGIPVLLDTAGNVEFYLFEKVLPYIDECYFDLKSGTETGYAQVGGDLQWTIDNMGAVVAAGVPTVVRIPIIPGFNDSVGSAEQMTRVLAGIEIKRVDLLPFHRLGSSKYTALGKNYQYKDIATMRPEQMKDLLAIFRENGFEVAVGG